MFLLLLLLELGKANEFDVTALSAPLRVVQQLSEASLPVTMFGSGWKKPDSLIVDDWGKLSDLSTVHREVVDELNLKAQLEPFGIVGVADYTLVRTTAPFNTVTVNVFLFANPAKCDEWWEKKCQYEGWGKDFEVVKSDHYQALDVINAKYTKKRLIKFDRLFLSTLQLGNDDKHLKAAEHIIGELTRNDER